MSVPVETEPTSRPGIPTVMFELPPFYRSAVSRLRRQWDIAPDGERFLVINPGDATPTGEASQPRMVVVLN